MEDFVKNFRPLPFLLSSSFLALSACSSGPSLRVDSELVEKLPQAQQNKISRIGLAREDAKEQREKAARSETEAKDALNLAKQDRERAEKRLELAKAAMEAADAKEDLAEANVLLAKEMTSAADQNLQLSMLNYEIEKAKAVQAQGLKSPAEIGLLQFEKESYQAQKKLTETNLRTVTYQNKVSKLAKEYREKQEKVEELKF